MDYIAQTDSDRQAMLRAMGAEGIEDLFSDIPADKRFPKLDLPPGKSELEVSRELSGLADRNLAGDPSTCFLGAGAYRHFIPAVVDYLAGRGEFATAYTPYQAEASQGTLQAIFEYQTMAARLLGVDVVNASHYDGPTAVAEAALLAIRATRRNTVVLAEGLHPQAREVTRSYLEPIDAGWRTVAVDRTARSGDALGVFAPLVAACTEDTAAVVVQNPDFFGRLRDIRGLAEAVHQRGALLVVHTNPIALGIFRSPGGDGADIVTGEGQPLGIPVGFGGPYLGLFGCSEALLRRMPGRLVGETVDTEGRRGFVLTLSTREQHIRRGRATSNICTNQGLMALRAAIYLCALGPSGLAETARLCYDNAHYAAGRIGAIPGYAVDAAETFFHEFVVSTPVPAADIVSRAAREGILAGYDLSRSYRERNRELLVCVTEQHTKASIDRFVEVLSRAGGPA